MSLVGPLGLLLAAVLLQASWPRALRPAGLTPDLTLALVLTFGVAGRPGAALLLALVGGTLLDLLSALPPGTNLASCLAAAAVASLVALDPQRGRPWIALLVPPVGTVLAYVVAEWRLWLAGWPVAWPSLLASLPGTVALVTAIVFGGRLLSAWLVAPRRPSLRL